MENVDASVFISKSALRAPLDALTVGQTVEFSLGTNALGLVGSNITLAAEQPATASSSAATSVSNVGSNERAARRVRSPTSAAAAVVPPDGSPKQGNPRKRAWTAKATVTAKPCLETATALPADLEPRDETPAAEGSAGSSATGGPSVDQRLAEHARRRDATDAALAAAYASTVRGFAASQLSHLRADHLSSHHAAGIVATDADDAGAARIDRMQRMVLLWEENETRPDHSSLISSSP